MKAMEMMRQEGYADKIKEINRLFSELNNNELVIEAVIVDLSDFFEYLDRWGSANGIKPRQMTGFMESLEMKDVVKLYDGMVSHGFSFYDDDAANNAAIQEAFDEWCEKDGKEYAQCVWCEEVYPIEELHREVDMGLLCDHCIEAIRSRGEKLVIEE